MLANGSIPDHVVKTYVGPNKSRERNVIFSKPEYYHNGMAELNFRITKELLNN
jgi:hypothetical protein